MKRSPKHFAHIKQANEKGKSPRDWVRTAEKLEENTERYRLMCGLTSMVTVASSVPCFTIQSFLSISSTIRSSVPAKEWVPIAERLEKRFGQLPICNWLIQNGYSGLDQAIRLHPELFAHIKPRQQKGAISKGMGANR